MLFNIQKNILMNKNMLTNIRQRIKLWIVKQQADNKKKKERS